MSGDGRPGGPLLREHTRMAVRRDPVQQHQRHHPVALWFDDEEEVFSGSIVIDEDGASGLGAPGAPVLVAIYTTMSKTRRRQAQSIAHSVDGGLIWVKHAGNPVLDRGSTDFRDPKVFRWDGDGPSYWVMVAVEALERRVVFYRSEDLLRWESLSEFGPAGAVGGEWECPDLFPLRVEDSDRVRWVLLVSLNAGCVAGGSGTQYFVGDFDGVTFTAEHPETTRWLDYGRDCYAGVSFTGLPDADRTLIAWMNNWDYARQMPVDPAAPQRGRMTLARRLSLTDVDGDPRLRQVPVGPELREHARVDNLALDLGQELDLPIPPAGRLDLAVDPGSANGFAVELAGDDGSRVTVEYDAVAGVIHVDRRGAARGFPPAFAGVERMPVARNAPIAITLWYDRHGLELFAEDGTRVLTDLTGALTPTLVRVGGRGGQIRIVELAVSAAAPPSA
ncbi:hypothetical protein MBRU_01365 [Mycolicibacterium brumae DSM 44177]|nr:hypothetical protein MBRU_01365 [Mycolicibacterium brumae DSM 44177]